MKIAVTNNPMVHSKVPGAGQNLIDFHDTDYLGVLKIVRDRVHLGHKLLTHPLSGSIKPGETPYKTVVISAEKGEMDEAGLSIIESSIQTCLKFMANGCNFKKNWSEGVLLDFQLIDYSLIFSEGF